jgi:hypothetical protein
VYVLQRCTQVRGCSRAFARDVDNDVDADVATGEVLKLMFVPVTAMAVTCPLPWNSGSQLFSMSRNH